MSADSSKMSPGLLPPEAPGPPLSAAEIQAILCNKPQNFKIDPNIDVCFREEQHKEICQQIKKLVGEKHPVADRSVVYEKNASKRGTKRAKFCLINGKPCGKNCKDCRR